MSEINSKTGKLSETGKKLSFEDLGKIMDQLLGEDGCPWDKEQTHESLKRYLIEESYEVLEAIDDNDPEGLKEELGDVLLQIFFHSKLAEKAGTFTMEDITDTISRKLIRRHPHVFATTEVENAEEVTRNWDEIKNQEKLEKNISYESMLDKVPKNLPSLLESLKIQEKVGKVGFDWDTIEEVAEKVREEEEELKEAIQIGDQQKIEEEFGDLLFTLVSIGRFLNLDPEESLFKANNKFRRRFRYIEENFRDKSLEIAKKNRKSMEKLWKESKKNV